MRRPPRFHEHGAEITFQKNCNFFFKISGVPLPRDLISSGEPGEKEFRASFLGGSGEGVCLFRRAAIKSCLQSIFTAA